ncbi:DUF4062 domain-containing protein [Enterobacter sp. 276E10]|uniref:DUF4062 domain-containing protein n=1 Tax=Enterobacter TaxID=547 RepID=UPI002A82825A|nr:DUF4062 domain-containing protein [Enterobacter sp. 276E10]
MSVRYQIFVSSTYTDLFPARRKVTEHILSMNHIPAGMEMFSASGRQQWSTIQKAIDNSDYYVLIVGERYGSISPDDGISYTEKEFNYAISNNIPTLCFLPGKNFTTSRENRETDPTKIEKLDEFKRKISDKQLCDFWESENELVSKISAALYKIFTEEPGIGWIRGNAADPQALTKLVQAMEENKALRQRIQQLEENNKMNLPSLSILINGHNSKTGPLVYNLPEPNNPVKFTPDLEMADIPVHLMNLISQELIDEYNASKPDKSQIESHNETLRFYQGAIEGKLLFSIKNDGPVKANNVSIRIKLPEGLRSLSERDVKRLKKPELHMPPDIIKIAEEKYNSQIFPNRSEFFNPLRSTPDFLSPDLPGILNKHVVSYNLTKSYDGLISGRRESVRQVTLENLTSDIYLIPIKRGTFSISIEILCDEYRQWDVTEMDIIIA